MIKRFSYLLSVVLFGGLLFVPMSKADPKDGKVDLAHFLTVNSSDITWVDAPPSLPPGAKMAVVHGDPKKAGLFAMRLILPSGYSIPPHWHPADEHVTVISGTFNMGHGSKFDKKRTTKLKAGGFARMKKGTHHFAWAKGKTVVQVHAIGPWGINYVNPADDPRMGKK